MLIFRMEIASFLQDILLQVHNAAVKSGRKPEDIELVAVSKTVELERIKEAVIAGVRKIGFRKLRIK